MTDQTRLREAAQAWKDARDAWMWNVDERSRKALVKAGDKLAATLDHAPSQHTPHDPPDYLRAAAESVVGAWYAGTGPPTEAQVRARAVAVAHLADVLRDADPDSNVWKALDASEVVLP